MTPDELDALAKYIRDFDADMRQWCYDPESKPQPRVNMFKLREAAESVEREAARLRAEQSAGKPVCTRCNDTGQAPAIRRDPHVPWGHWRT